MARRNTAAAALIVVPVVSQAQLLKAPVVANQPEATPWGSSTQRPGTAAGLPDGRPKTRGGNVAFKADNSPF